MNRDPEEKPRKRRNAPSEVDSSASPLHRPPTLKDIAQRVGVSQATVSAILSESAQAAAFAESTRKDVKDAANALGYSFNPLARALRRGRSGVLGCLLFNQLDIYYARVAQVAEAHAKERGYGFVGVSMGYDFSRLDACLNHLMAWRVEGILLLLGGRTAPDALLTRLVQLGVPYLTGDWDSTEGTGGVGEFARQSGAIAVQHLWDLGHREIAVLGVNPSNLHSHVRLQGIIERLKEHGATPDEALLVSIPAGLHGPNAGETSVQQLIKGRRPFTGLICLNDLLALGALAELHRNGIEVPGMVSVVGFDDLPLDVAGTDENRLGRFTTPALTTVRLPTREICISAMSRLISKVQGEKSGELPLPAQPELVTRASTACCT